MPYETKKKGFERMLTYSSELQLKDDCTKQNLLDCINDWFIESKLGEQWMFEKQCSPFDIYCQDQKEEFEAECQGIKMNILNSQDLLLVQIKSENNDFKRNTYMVFREKTDADEAVIFVGEAIDLKRIGISIPEADTGLFAKEFVQTLFWNELQAPMDGSVQNSDRTIFVHASDLESYHSLLSLTDKSVRIPVLYLPYSISSYARDFEAPFIGRLHILAESTPIVAKKLEELVGFNHYSKSVMMILPGGESKYVLAADNGFEVSSAIDNVKGVLRTYWMTHPIDKRFSLSAIKEDQLMRKFGEDAELKSVFDSILADKEAEITALSQELNEVKGQLRDEQSKNSSLQSGFDKVSDGLDSGMFETTEKPKYEHEFEDIILKVLEKERDSMSGDSALSTSRKYHVLCDILAHNFPSGTDTDLSKLIKEVFEQGKLTRDGIGRLQSAGFTVTKNDKKAHYRVLWQDDERYAATYSATGSDFRGGKNCASDFINMCFGY